MVTPLKLLTAESISALPSATTSVGTVNHVDAVTAKASRTLEFLQRNFEQCTMEVKSTAYTSGETWPQGYNA